jgi:hypothetical protein
MPGFQAVPPTYPMGGAYGPYASSFPNAAGFTFPFNSSAQGPMPNAYQFASGPTQKGPMPNQQTPAQNEAVHGGDQEPAHDAESTRPGSPLLVPL